MNRSLKEIIKEVGKEYEMEEDIINDIIKKLQKEFYVKLKHMKNLSIETWKSLDLPINLYYVLNELYQSAFNEEQQSNPQNEPNNNKINVINEKPYNPIPQQNQQKSQQQTQNIRTNNSKNNIQEFPLNKNIFKDQNNLSNIIHNDLSIIFTEIDNRDISRQVFKQIYNIINNIAHNPMEEKFRRFNITKFISKFKYNSLVNFFLHIGFKRVDEYMYLIGEAKNITDVMKELNQFIKDNKIAQSTFDPYKGSISSLTGNEEKLKKVQTTEVNFEDLYYNEIERRNDIIRKSKIERKPKLYELEKNYSLNRIINTINQNEEDLISNSNEDKLIIKKNLALLKEKENDRFTLKSRTRLEQLMKTPIYVKSDIRLKFPNEIILQGSFALYETIGDIYKFINNYLKDKNEKFNISTTPPLKRYLKMDNTIQEEKLYPNLLMYVNFEEQFSGLDEEKIKDIKCNLELMDLVEEEEEEIFTGPGQKVGGQ
jgi:tether containing UBX domain for GLUT4